MYAQEREQVNPGMACALESLSILTKLKCGDGNGEVREKLAITTKLATHGRVRKSHFVECSLFRPPIAVRSSTKPTLPVPYGRYCEESLPLVRYVLLH